MNLKFKKVISSIAAGVLLLTQSAFAAEFVDMPDNWSTEALKKAVSDGLLSGSGGYIHPDDYMTRAEMATIMARACGAVNEADISSFTDVKPDDWFYSSMAKAVAMQAFTGSDNKLNPEDYITRQEAFVVLARVFSLNLDKNIDKTVVDGFKDGESVASWAKESVAAIVSGGYVAGNDGYINPESNISRAEFAVVMSRLVSYYIDDASLTEIPSDGNVMIRVGGFNIDGAKGDKMIVLGDGVGKTDVSLKNSALSGKLVVRGGENVVLEGKFGEVRIVMPYVRVECGDADTTRIYGCKDSVIDIGTLTTPDTSAPKTDAKDDSKAEPAAEDKTENGDNAGQPAENGADAE